MKQTIIQGRNPIIPSDFPDPCIIRVDDIYYMVSTTMHFFPGASILRSFDLVQWEFVGHVYDELDASNGQKLNEATIYGQGMWAPSFVYHDGCYYLLFSANDTKKTYLFKATHPAGPWTKHDIEGFYHDASLIFEGPSAYLVYGNHSIYLVELNEQLTAAKEGANPMLIVRDDEGIRLGYEGAHLLKHEGQFYLFLINWASGEEGKRNAWCFVASDIKGPYYGKCIVNDDLDYPQQGIAQGAMIDTPDGSWYLYLFQDRGALGRVPIVIPMEFEDIDNDVSGVLRPGIVEQDWSSSRDKLQDESYIQVHEMPTHTQRTEEGMNKQYIPTNGNIMNREVYKLPRVKDGKVPQVLKTQSSKAEHAYTALYGNAFVDSNGKLSPYWQFNHQADPHHYSFDPSGYGYEITSAELSPTLIHSKNTLTQRTIGPICSGTVTLDASSLLDGDYMGLACLQGCYAAVAITKEEDDYYLVMMSRTYEGMGTMGHVYDYETPEIVEKIRIDVPILRVSSYCSFSPGEDWTEFSYEADGITHSIGLRHHLYFKLDHFVGCRYALFYYATRHIGGTARFTDFSLIPKP